MPKTEYPEFGPVNERTFPAVALDADSGLRASLEDFKSRGRIRDYREENGILTLWRPWIEGVTQDEFFRWLPSGERTNYSHQLFRRVQRKLEEIGDGHGALHPRNIILRQGGSFELVDAIFNRARLNPPAVPQDDPWLWGPSVPKGWTLKNWDRVSLLRTAALLAENPSTWERPIPAEQAAEMCRKWADELIQSAPAGADFIPAVGEVLKLLPELFDATFELPPEALATQQGDPIEVAAPSPLSAEEGVELSAAASAVTPELSTPLPKTDIDRTHKERCDMPLSMTQSVKNAITKNRTAWQVCAFTIGVALAVIGIMLSEHDGVFRDLGDLRDWRSSLWGPSSIEQINISDLMHDRHLGRKIVYVFALDVSGSLSEAEVTDGDREFFFQRMAADQLDEADNREEVARMCALRKSGLKQWHLPQAQVCYYLHSIEDGAYVGLWKFGASPTRVSGSRADQLEPDLRPAEEGMRKRLIDRLMLEDMAPQRRTTDFGSTDFLLLLNQLYDSYVRGRGYRDRDVRIVIVSDFIHDARIRDRAFYSLSRQSIDRKLKEFSKADNVTFHLMVIGSNQTDGFILPSFEKHTRLNQHVVDSFEREPATPMPDFLYGFVTAEKELVFRHSADSDKVHPIYMMWDKVIADKDDSQLIVGLRTAAYKETNQSIPIYVSEGRPDEPCPLFGQALPRISRVGLDSSVLKPGGRQDFTIGRPGDWVCLQPLEIESQNIYQLTLSCGSDRAGRSVHVVNIKFQKYMPEMAARVLVVCMALMFLAPFVCIVLTLISMIWRRAPGRSSVSEGAGRA